MWKMPEKSEESSSSINADKLTSATNPDKASAMAIAILLDKYCYPVVLPKSRDVGRDVGAGGEEAEGGERGQREMPNHLKKQFAAIVATDPLHPLSPEDKELLWHFRHECMRDPRYLFLGFTSLVFFSSYFRRINFLPNLFLSSEPTRSFWVQSAGGNRKMFWQHTVCWSAAVRGTAGKMALTLPIHVSVVSRFSVSSPVTMFLFSGLDVGLAMQLLDCHYSDAQVRSMAVRKLETLEDDDVLRYLLQLVQV